MFNNVLIDKDIKIQFYILNNKNEYLIRCIDYACALNNKIVLDNIFKSFILVCLRMEILNEYILYQKYNLTTLMILKYVHSFILYLIVEI